MPCFDVGKHDATECALKYIRAVPPVGATFENAIDELAHLDIVHKEKEGYTETPILASAASRPSGTVSPEKGKSRVGFLLKTKPFVMTFNWYDIAICN